MISLVRPVVPSPMSLPEIEKMLAASKAPEETPTVKMEFANGDPIKIKEGPFENMEGTVDELLPAQGKVTGHCDHLWPCHAIGAGILDDR